MHNLNASAIVCNMVINMNRNMALYEALSQLALKKRRKTTLEWL